MEPRILIVDDEPLVRNFVAAALIRHGYHVLAASNAAEAEMTSGIDLLLTEWELPDSSGPSLAARMRQKQPGLPVIFTTGQSRIETQEAVLYKPFTAGMLMAAIGSRCCCHPKAA